MLAGLAGTDPGVARPGRWATLQDTAECAGTGPVDGADVDGGGGGGCEWGRARGPHRDAGGHRAGDERGVDVPGGGGVAGNGGAERVVSATGAGGGAGGDVPDPEEGALAGGRGHRRGVGDGAAAGEGARGCTRWGRQGAAKPRRRAETGCGKAALDRFEFAVRWMVSRDFVEPCPAGHGCGRCRWRWGRRRRCSLWGWMTARSRPVTRSSSVSRLEIMTTGASLRARTVRRTSKPSMSGTTMSRRTRAGAAWWIRARVSAPVADARIIVCDEDRVDRDGSAQRC